MLQLPQDLRLGCIMRQINWPSVGPSLLKIARQAGDRIMSVYQSAEHSLVDIKGDESPLTKADLASHVCICDALHQLTPEIPVVSEESAESLVHRLGTNQFWLIDPLDGTKEFLARNGEFTVNIALIVDGNPVWGVVYAPAMNLLYWGGRDFGAYRESDGASVQLRVARPVTADGTYRVVASKSHLNAETEAFIERLGNVSLIQAGSSLKLCRVAEGEADVYPRLAPTCEWDTAAAQAVVEGAGGFVVDTAGDALVYGKEAVLNPYFIVSSVPLSELINHD